MENNMDPRIIPWGAPHVREADEEKHSSISCYVKNSMKVTRYFEDYLMNVVHQVVTTQ